jgi:DNA-binding protein HU-beta
MNKQDLTNFVAAETGLSAQGAAAAVNAVLAGVQVGLTGPDRKVVLTGFGVFEAVGRPERDGRNPATGERIRVPAMTAAKWRPGATLKAALNNGA